MKFSLGQHHIRTACILSGKLQPGRRRVFAVNHNAAPHGFDVLRHKRLVRRDKIGLFGVTFRRQQFVSKRAVVGD